VSRRWSGVVRVAVVLAGFAPAGFVLAGAPTADADTPVVIGETTLTSNAPNQDDFGINMPVFQGDASGNYVLSASSTGTITSWSFLSGGVPTGSSYELAVLAPVDTMGQQWRLVAVSAPESVTSTAGTDTVMGPYALSPGIAISAGSRIALLPVNTGTVPIEQGVIGQDGIRQFPQPFGGLGSSETIVSAMDNGQVVPIQATVGSALSTIVTKPSISGTAADGQTLQCALGSWTGSPNLTNTWTLTTQQLEVTGGSNIKPVLTTVTTQVGSGDTYAVPDLAPGGQLSCVVNAENGAGSVTAVAGPLDVTALRPKLAPPGGLIGHSHLSSHPKITAGVGVGGTNHCSAGIWLHHPSRYRFAWHRTARTNKIVARTSTYKPVPADIGHFLNCTVTASNSAGSSPAAKSNGYVVPRTSPKALSAPSLSVAVTPKQGTLVKHPSSIDGDVFALRCGNGSWNLPNLTFSYALVFDGAGTVTRTQKPHLTGTVLPLPGKTATISVHSVSDGVPPANQPFLIEDSTLTGTQIDDTVQCEVTATAPNGLSGTALTSAVLLAGPV
jgi:hypothetical protein